MPPATHQSVGGLASALWRRKFWILIPTIIAFLASMAIVNMLRVRYTGEARVLLENRETVFSRPDRDNRGSDPQIDPEAVASQVQVVQSKELALKVIRDLELVQKSEFDPISRGMGISGSVLVALGFIADPRQIPQEERVFDTFRKRLLVFPQGKSRVISIEFQSEDPELAARIANRIAEEYLRREESAKSQTGRATSEWLDRAIDPLTKRVQEAEAKVEAFRSKKGLFIGSNNMTITSQQLAELNSQLANARSLQADLQARAKLIREAVRLGRVFETSEVNNNELVRRLLEQRAALKAQIAFEERTLLPGHPRMKELGSQLRDLEMQVRSAAERAARSFENDSRAAGARVESLQAELNSQKKSAALSNEDEVQLKALERDATSLREQLNSYRARFLDAAARSGETTSPADARIISRAFAQNEPTFPKKLPIVLLATLGTLVVCSALVASLHLMSMQSAMPDPNFGYGYPGMPLPPVASASGPMVGEGVAQSAKAAMPPPLEYSPSAAPPNWPVPRPAWPGFRQLFTFGRKSPQVTPASPPMWTTHGAPAAFGAEPARAAMPDPAQPGAQPATETPPAAFPEAYQHRPGMQAAEDVARELALLGYIGRGKVLMIHGAEGDARTALHAMRFGRRLVREGAAVVVDLVGLSDLYPRVMGQDLPGLADYLRGDVSLGDLIHRDPKSPLDVLMAGEALMRQLHAPDLRRELIGVIEALSESYGFVIVDAGPAGGVGEALASLADLFVLLTRRHPEDDALFAISERLEAARGAQVLLVPDEAANAAGGAPLGASNGVFRFDQG
jgi:uncharacterized protein involved in exopolysaccharide biosynthesis/Mrp family chromosome partitioning ATPase